MQNWFEWKGVRVVNQGWEYAQQPKVVAYVDGREIELTARPAHSWGPLPDSEYIMTADDRAADVLQLLREDRVFLTRFIFLNTKRVWCALHDHFELPALEKDPLGASRPPRHWKVQPGPQDRRAGLVGNIRVARPVHVAGRKRPLLAGRIVPRSEK